MGQPGTGAQVALPAGGRLGAEQVGEELGVGQLLLRRHRQPALQHGSRLVQSEVGQLMASDIDPLSWTRGDPGTVGGFTSLRA